MLVPTARDLRVALSRYADAVIEDLRHSTPDTVGRREDAAHTLCVMTGVSDERSAPAAADALLRAIAPAGTSRPVPGGPAPTDTVAA